jgi:amino acid permease
MNGEEGNTNEKLEDNLGNADLPSLHRKNLKKVIIFSIVCVVFFGWGVYSGISYFSHPDFEGVSID